MAVERCRKRLRDEVTCSICLDFLAAPVTLDCGHNFCQTCIVQSWKDSPTGAACPQCRERIQSSNLRLNRQLARVVQVSKELSELLKHRMVPVEEVAQEYKGQISRSLESLRKDRENILGYKTESKKESRVLLNDMEYERKSTATAFRELHQFLEEQEKQLLTQLEEVEKEIARSRDEHLARLSGELSSLDTLIRELEEKHQQSADELLQDIGDILERCKKESFENPVAFPVALKWKIHDFCDINVFLEAIMKRFKESLVSGLPLQEAKVTLDPNTAHPELILSEDLKSVRWENYYKDMPSNPERFDYHHFVLGQEGFKAGRHYWDVDVGLEEEWSVGVARGSMRRKGNFYYTDVCWNCDVGLWDGEYRTSADLLQSQKVLKKIRVILNYDGDRVTFFDAHTGAELYEWLGAYVRETIFPFDRDTVFPIFSVLKEGKLTICL